ncbi:hypothetical protein [Candidatus Endomicrobiellum agilis]|nr:hypothetical protein [Endomicrobium sp.]
MLNKNWILLENLVLKVEEKFFYFENLDSFVANSMFSEKIYIAERFK